MVRRRWQIRTASLALIVVAGLLIVSPGPAAGQPGPQGSVRERCQAVLPQAQVEPIAARYRDRFVAAREALMKEERALRSLLVADASTRAALDVQIVKTEAARAAFSRVQVDLLWELRSVVPASDRELAFRCAARLLVRRR